MVLIIFYDFAQANKHALRKASLCVSHLKEHLRNSNMIEFRVKNLFNLLNYIVYTVFICIAFYLIHQGDIVQRFQQKRTNFAEYSEKVRQLPTMYCYLDSIPARCQSISAPQIRRKLFHTPFRASLDRFHNHEIGPKRA